MRYYVSTENSSGAKYEKFEDAMNEIQNIISEYKKAHPDKDIDCVEITVNFS